MILEVRELKKYYPVEAGIFKAARGFVKAVDGISFSLDEEEVLGVVGESGCGKSTLAKLILKLIAPTAGEIIFSAKISHLRKDVGIVFQDPFLSLDPKMRIRDIIAEPFRVHHLKDGKKKSSELLEAVGLDAGILNRFPSQLSGGQRQRVSLARSLAVGPKLLVLDEPLSSLDLIILRQILDLLAQLKARLKMTYIFISHNIAVIKKISSRVLVMYEGKVAEEGPACDIFINPKSEYTKKLLEAAS